MRCEHLFLRDGLPSQLALARLRVLQKRINHLFHSRSRLFDQIHEMRRFLRRAAISSDQKLCQSPHRAHRRLQIVRERVRKQRKLVVRPFQLINQPLAFLLGVPYF